LKSGDSASLRRLFSPKAQWRAAARGFERSGLLVLIGVQLISISGLSLIAPYSSNFIPGVSGSPTP